MTIRNISVSLLFFFSATAFAQDSLKTSKLETKISFLDSIKSTFVHDKIASCVDSLWMKELTNLDLYNELSVDIKTINIDEKVDFELPTALLKSRLKELDAKSPFNIEYNQGLENIIKSFLKNRKKSFERLMAISEYYFPLFEEALARQNVPLEIKYLAVVESALNPKAVSRVGATGLWQFMFQTGKQYNLNIDSYVDERSDPIKSSDAAALYMSNMYKIFGDWDLVLASYNSGPGNVAKAIRRSGGQQNYWNIRKNLPKETQGYVPAFLATMYIYEYHAAHGIVPNRAIVKHFATDTIQIKHQISFKQIADLIDIPIAQLQLLNPSYKRDVIPYVKGTQNFLRLPNDKIAIYTSNEDKIYAYVQHELSKKERPYQSTIAVNNNTDSRAKTKYYKVKRGDNLSSIANKFGVTKQVLKEWNNLKGSSVSRGKNLKIYLPTTELVADSKPLATPLEELKNNSTEKKYKEEKVVSFVEKTKNYKVKRGDNLGEIASKYGVTVSELKKWNRLKSNALVAGKSLQIKTTEKVVRVIKKETTLDPAIVVATTATALASKNEGNTTAEEATKTPEYYIVQKGDNLSSIAKNHKITVEELKQWNNLADANIQLESKLKITQVVNEIQDEQPKKAEFSTKEYTVVKGDNLAAIAKKNGVSQEELKEWNSLTDTTIKLGSVLIVAKNKIENNTNSTTLEKGIARNNGANSPRKKQDHYYVKKGDSLYTIAKKYPGITISDIKKWNGISNENLKPGMKLKING
jgi:membrane-bound lytic murein transglycosylase D